MKQRLQWVWVSVMVALFSACASAPSDKAPVVVGTPLTGEKAPPIETVLPATPAGKPQGDQLIATRRR